MGGAAERRGKGVIGGAGEKGWGEEELLRMDGRGAVGGAAVKEGRTVGRVPHSQ